MCALLPCAEVFPGATHFSERKGQPPYVEAYDRNAPNKKLLGYVMLSTDITDTPAYSGKPVVTLIGMDTRSFVGVKVLKHSEPILLLGIPESALHQFQQSVSGQVRGRQDRSRPVSPRRRRDRSGRHLRRHGHGDRAEPGGDDVGPPWPARSGIIQPTVRDPARFAVTGKRYDWAQLVQHGAVQRLRRDARTGRAAT
jgi:NosR/NirI family nitrous oxide reductase transcriptional regulator